MPVTSLSGASAWIRTAAGWIRSAHAWRLARTSRPLEDLGGAREARDEEWQRLRQRFEGAVDAAGIPGRVRGASAP